MSKGKLSRVPSKVESCVPKCKIENPIEVLFSGIKYNKPASIANAREL